jgi:DNA polymerase-1
MINIQNNITDHNLKSKMLVQVHDELIFEIHNSELEQMQKIIKNEMENAFTLKVPLAVDIGIGENWFEAH